MTAHVGKGVESGKHVSTTVRNQLWSRHPAWELVCQFLKKLRLDLPKDWGIPLLGTYPKDPVFFHRDIYSTMCIAALLIIARDWKQPRCV